MPYNRRYLHDFLGSRPKNFRVVLITGPRRSGKSTFSKALLADWGGSTYVTFDTPLEQARFSADPEGYLRALPVPAVLDEVQNVPQIFSYLKKLIDEKPEDQCDFILTGSQQFQMMKGVADSLAGRILIKELLPFSLGEAQAADPKPIRRNFETLLLGGDTFTLADIPVRKTQLLHLIATGGFPPAVLLGEGPTADNERSEWFNSYVETYIQRDVRGLSNLQNLGSFTRFVNLIAGRTGQLINYSELGKDIGVNYKSAQHYLSLLETSYLWKSLPPFFIAGSEKRLSKTPKGVFLDTGLAVFLTGLTSTGLERNSLAGAFFESLVAIEFIKLSAAFGMRIAPFHFKAGNTAEVDLVIEHAGKTIPIEIKFSASPDSGWGRSIKTFKEIVGMPPNNLGYVISLHPEVRSLGAGTLNVPFGAFVGMFPAVKVNRNFRAMS